MVSSVFVIFLIVFGTFFPLGGLFFTGYLSLFGAPREEIGIGLYLWGLSWLGVCSWFVDGIAEQTLEV